MRYLFRINRVMSVLLAGLCLCGCQWVDISDHTTPQVSGRVLSAETHEPLAGVKVSAILPGQPLYAGDPGKGAERQMQGRPIVTDSEGRFTFPSHEYVTLLRRGNWWSVSLSFQCFRYVTWRTNFSAADFKSEVSNGIPRVEAGDIYLKPVK